jgi:RNA polymerase sigma-70 factor (ECF subfamily)
VAVPEVQRDPSDADLIEAWQGGEEAAATELVRRHARAVARYLSAAGAGDDVDDLVQETLFRAFRKLGGYRGQASFRTWLMAIGSNALKDLRRRGVRRPTVALEERDVVDEASDPHAETAARDAAERLEQAVAALPEMQRDVFLLRAQQGMEYEDIAGALDTSVGAARVHYHHAVKRLKKVLE